MQDDTKRGNTMGTWDIGPFDNDAAADWCGDLDDAAPPDRAGLIRSVLLAVIDEGAAYLDGDFAAEAIAALAVVASQLPGGPSVDSSYAPDFLLGGGSVVVPADVPALGLRVLDRIVAPDSEWHELWAEAGELDKALATLEPIRTALSRAIG